MTSRCLIALCAAAALSACRQDMHDAPRYDPLEASTAFADGSSARMLVEGTVARGLLNEDELLHTGKTGGQPSPVFPFTIARADLDRGNERYDVFCAPCHSKTGDGNGMVVQRGFRPPPSFHSDRLRQAPPGHVFDVITNGFGVMPDYRAQIPADDRWRIVAYLKALQLAQQGSTADLTAADLARLRAGETAPAADAASGTAGAGAH